MPSQEDVQKVPKLRVFIETFGCQMNILDTELLIGQLKKAGHSFVQTPDQANVVLLNTCSVRALSEQKVLSRLGIIRERKARGEKVIVGVLGCMAERTNTDLLKGRPYIDLMVGPSRLNETLHLIEEAALESTSKTKTALSEFRTRNKRTDQAALLAMDDLEALDRERTIDHDFHHGQAYVRITRGCNKFCSFCVVPRTRGPELHRTPASIVDEVKRLTDHGILEVTLLGQTINHYVSSENGRKISFADLLFRIHEQVPALQRLRFLTSYPRDFSDEALDVMASLPRICKYLHIPAQSGSNEILKRMNRGYTIEEYLGLIERAKMRMPDISIIGDIIVGFPTETDADFEQTVELLKTVRYKNVFVFKYSPRPNTTANERLPDDVPETIKKTRNNFLLDLQAQITLEHHERFVGNTVSILVEGQAKLDPEKDPANDFVTLRKKEAARVKLMGRTTGDHIVHFEGTSDLIGQIVPVSIISARALSMSGILSA